MKPPHATQPLPKLTILPGELPNLALPNGLTGKRGPRKISPVSLTRPRKPPAARAASFSTPRWWKMQSKSKLLYASRLKYDLRLAIKSSGHCFLGHSTAPESLQVSTSKLKSLNFVDRFRPDGAPGYLRSRS